MSKDAEIDFTGYVESVGDMGDDDVEEEEYDSEIEIIEENIERETITDNTKGITNPRTYIGDDGDFLDELLANAWYDENGEPIAGYLPLRVCRACGGWWAGMLYSTDNFGFIDGSDLSIDTLKRTKPAGKLYALLLQDIRKEQGADGTMCNYATEYFSKEAIVFKGKFETMLNGDNIILFAEYTGLADDDTPNFKGYYAEIHNEGRF